MCHKNFDGTPAAMEAEAAVKLWPRSTNHNFRYVTFVSDRDSSAYNAVCALNDGRGPYDVPVQKEECINHVAKRLGTRLRKFKQGDFTVITTRTGKKMKRSALGGAKKLTNNVIQMLQRYYKKAISDNKNRSVESMRNAIMASFYHACSSDKAPKLHNLCPKDINSWCFYQRVLAPDETPRSHSVKPPYLSNIPSDKQEDIKRIYIDLTRTRAA
ncbi:hypothetical protein GWK47_052685 [Chionoecetes opilio]|uniref:Mutator-like transposase domain-containing protein n=1 Tax=Chionoecetes opilio TaxID=41210 RepID=A0A8J4Y677_CHIOP|nr:hypothetical protein GWK47_052685 [Chionoecetes opilio]